MRQHARVWLLLLLGALTGLALAMAPGAQAQRVDLASVAREWTADFEVRGMKTEPTFVEQVQYRRAGDRFTLQGSIHGEDLGTFAVDLASDGSVVVAACPPLATCADARPNGFLSTVAVLAALRQGTLAGDGDAVRYAGRDAVCVPLELIQPAVTASNAAAVVMDPCFERQTGAVLAHRRRFDGQFGGATLDEATLHFSYTPTNVSADIDHSAWPAPLAALLSRLAS